ncbi:MAG: hypothetical protein LUH82_04680 [Clostridiales bacterium]|nr:hypothetical protein [Clostridiales bacterium]
MENTKKAKNKILFRCLACVLAAAVVVAAAFGIKSLSAKYIKNYTLNGSVYIETKTDADVQLYEHKAYLQSDGSYLLDTEAAEVSANTYSVLPGVDIPKDPCLYITDLTETSYVYIEVCEQNKTDAVTFTLESCWVEVAGATGINGGKVYVYSTDGTNPALVTSGSTVETFTQTSATTSVEPTTADPGQDLSINIIKDQTVYVSASYAAGTDYSLTFYGYVAEAAAGEAAASIYTTYFSA